MDSWETRYMHEGRTYVRDDYSGTTIPLDVYLKMSSMGSQYVPTPVVSSEVVKHPYKGKQVKFTWGGAEVIGKVRKVTSTPEGDCAEIRASGMQYFISVVKLQQV